jgi:hypothetical protein
MKHGTPDHKTDLYLQKTTPRIFELIYGVYTVFALKFRGFDVYLTTENHQLFQSLLR